MPHKGPHISISAEYVVNRILRINLDEFERWPQSVRQLAIELAEELFLVAYNPFISASAVRKSVDERYQSESQSLAHQYATAISEGITTKPSKVVPPLSVSVRLLICFVSLCFHWIPFHVPMILSVHVPLGANYGPDGWRARAALYGGSYTTSY